MTNWYTADLHFGHESIIRLCGRPFRDADHMEAVILENLWSCVGPQDDLWILGDFAMGRNSRNDEWLRHRFDQLPGLRRHLVVGNHDRAMTLRLPWDSVSHFLDVRDDPDCLPNTLCHYPMVTWNHSRRGALQLFGHVHNNWKGTRNSVNVGVDVFDYMPAQLEDIRRRARTMTVNAHWPDVEPGLDLESG